MCVCVCFFYYYFPQKDFQFLCFRFEGAAEKEQNLSLIGGNREREEYYLFHVQSLLTQN